VRRLRSGRRPLHLRVTCPGLQTARCEHEGRWAAYRPDRDWK
jgi:hypothetical protein